MRREKSKQPLETMTTLDHGQEMYVGHMKVFQLSKVDSTGHSEKTEVNRKRG